MIVLEWLFLTIAPCDAAEPWQLGSQDAATPMMQGIIDLHHDIFFFLILILVFVSRILVRALWHFQKEKNPIPQRIVHGTTIEILRTIFPSIIPMFIAIPSFALLYSMDEVVVNPAITFDSYTMPEDALELGQLRLLEVDNRVVVPAKSHLRSIVTSADVRHSWAVQLLGIPVAYCDQRDAFSGPNSPVAAPAQELPESPPPPAVPVPEPLLAHQVRNHILYQRYLALDLGVGDPGDLQRMVSIISSQVLIEENIEQALLQDGWLAGSILDRYTDIRGIVHTPQGRLLSPRTYTAYVNQINEQGTRQSVPYRRILRALRNFDLLLERRR